MAASSNDRQKVLIRIFLGIVVLVLAGSMLLYLVPQMPGGGDAAASGDTVATVAGQQITLAELRKRLDEAEQQGQINRALESLYAGQLLKQMVFEKEIDYEAKRLGITVSDREVADRVRLFLPSAYNGDTFVGGQQYSDMVQQRFQMNVPMFEQLIRQSLLQEKFQRMITDGVSVGPAELQEEFRYRNEKVKVDYAYIKPEDLAEKITVDDAAIAAAYEKNKAKYQVPEKRVASYILVDINQIRQSVQISDDQLKNLYQQNIAQYQVPNRVKVDHILFMTVGKTDAEVQEVKQKAEDVLKQAKKGANFEDLAKKYSEDPGSKDKGGQLGWITEGQTVPEFQKVAFSLPKGEISDLVKTQYGFHIIKVLDKESAHTQPFDEVKGSIKAPLLLNTADRDASAEADRISTQIRQSPNTSLDDLSKQFHLPVAETRPVAASDAILEFGNSQEAKDALFHQRQGVLSLPIHTDRGYLVLSVKQIQPAHQGTLEEVRDRVVADLKQEKAAEVAHQKADELVKRLKSGEKFASAAKALGLEAKTSDPLSRNGSISGAASGKQLSAAFDLKPGDVGAPLPLGANWFVYQVADKEAPNPADFDKQKKEITDEVLQSKRSMAFEAFHLALENRLRAEGKLREMPDKLKGFGNINQPGSPLNL